MNEDWILTVKVRLRNFSSHDEDRAMVRKALMDEELAGLTDWPADYEIVSLEPAACRPQGQAMPCEGKA